MNRKCWWKVDGEWREGTMVEFGRGSTASVSWKRDGRAVTIEVPKVALEYRKPKELREAAA